MEILINWRLLLKKMKSVDIVVNKQNKKYSEKVTLLYGLFNGARMLIGAVNVLFLLSKGVHLSEIAQLQLIYSVSVYLLTEDFPVQPDVISVIIAKIGQRMLLNYRKKLLKSI